jgi:hypothetical protein
LNGGGVRDRTLRIHPVEQPLPGVIYPLMKLPLFENSIFNRLKKETFSFLCVCLSGQFGFKHIFRGKSAA